MLLSCCCQLFIKHCQAVHWNKFFFLDGNRMIWVRGWVMPSPSKKSVKTHWCLVIGYGKLNVSPPQKSHRVESVLDWRWKRRVMSWKFCLISSKSWWSGNHVCLKWKPAVSWFSVARGRPLWTGEINQYSIVFCAAVLYQYMETKYWSLNVKINIKKSQ